MQKIQEVLGKISYEMSADLPCVPEPCMVKDEAGNIIKLVTAQSQLHVIEKQKNVKSFWAPSYYQDCMKPEIKEIHSLIIHVLDENKLQLNTKYNEAVVELANVEIEVTAWKPGMQTNNCRNCRNCGRC